MAFQISPILSAWPSGLRKWSTHYSPKRGPTNHPLDLYLTHKQYKLEGAIVNVSLGPCTSAHRLLGGWCDAALALHTGV